MKKTTVTIDAYECETCGHKHTEDWYGKWSIFHCPEHGEFCNDGGGGYCCLFRYLEGRGDRASCPICGWTAIESYSEKYDERQGKKPRTEKEIESFKKAQKRIMDGHHIYSGYPAYKRIVEFKRRSN